MVAVKFLIINRIIFIPGYQRHILSVIIALESVLKLFEVPGS
jgi:hypothetical protein